MRFSKKYKTNQIAYQLDGLSGWLLKQLSPGRLLLLAILALAVCLLWAFYLHRTHETQNGYFLFITALAATAGFLLNAAIKLHSEMRDRAFKLIVTGRENTIYREAFRYGMKFLRTEAQDSAFDQQKMIALTEGETGHTQLTKCVEKKDEEGNAVEEEQPITYEEMRGHIGTIGNFFEEIAIAIEYREIYEPILLDYYHNILVSFYEAIEKDYLPTIRGERPGSVFHGKPNRKAVFENVEWLYDRWKKYNVAISKMLEGDEQAQQDIKKKPVTTADQEKVLKELKDHPNLINQVGRELEHRQRQKDQFGF